ncbi:hypothetical protein [Nocardioides limicola]|uniref:hypothetical protein n=1 Tax=Nocardioides limicola TaxID=2803368 RepID=UPI00193B89ED|nr:hypothetical protein [Nocardioides sp. DJM-14]
MGDNSTLDRLEHDHALASYRYLRIGMVVLVLALATSLVVEWLGTGASCLQPSISAYFYTPAQAVLVGSLVAIGAGLIIIKGNTDAEDTLLNLAGMLAPVVAFVPTPFRDRCFSAPVHADNQSAAVANNVTVLLVVGALGLVVTGWLGMTGRSRWAPAQRRGWLVAIGVYAVAAAAWCWHRDWFLDVAHYAAAVGMFGCIVAVVWLNALAYRRRTHCRPARNPYSHVAVLMLVLPALIGLGWWFTRSDHAVLWVEAALIALFAAFWVVQTRELWGEVVRAPAGQTRESSTSTS